MIVDWLLNEVPQDLLQNFEVYTFGCFANHFNNPYRDAISSAAATSYSTHGAAVSGNIHNRAISHIEHYANANDLACRMGVLAFTKTIPKNTYENRFMGRVFVNPRSGHQFNQHYLDTIFPLDPERRCTREPLEGDFMDMDILIGESRVDKIDREGPLLSLYSSGLMDALRATPASASREVHVEAEMLNVTPTSPRDIKSSTFNKGPREYGKDAPKKVKLRELSRLWLYRNGGSPII